MMLTQEEAEVLLAPYRETLDQCIRKGWDTYRSSAYEAFRSIYSPRTRANIVYDHIVAEAEHAFDATPGVQFHRARGLMVLVIGQEILMKLKKLDDRKLSRNYPTGQAMMFNMQGTIPGFPAQRTNLIAGYQLDKLKLSIESVLVTCPVGSKVVWNFPMVGQAAEPVQFPLPATGTSPAATDAIKDVKETPAKAQDDSEE